MRTAGWPCTACPGWPPECWERQGPRCKGQRRNAEGVSLVVRGNQSSEESGRRDNSCRGQGGRKEERTIPGEKPENKLKIKIVSKTIIKRPVLLDSSLSIDSRQDGKKRSASPFLFTNAAFFHFSFFLKQGPEKAQLSFHASSNFQKTPNLLPLKSIYPLSVRS